MTTTDVTRLYDLLDALRHESRTNLEGVREEVQGYRADLNGRLKALELEAAKRQGAGEARGSLGRLIWGVAAVSAAIGSVVGVVAALV